MLADLFMWLYIIHELPFFCFKVIYLADKAWQEKLTGQKYSLLPLPAFQKVSRNLTMVVISNFPRLGCVHALLHLDFHNCHCRRLFWILLFYIRCCLYCNCIENFVNWIKLVFGSVYFILCIPLSFIASDNKRNNWKWTDKWKKGFYWK